MKNDASNIVMINARLIILWFMFTSPVLSEFRSLCDLLRRMYECYRRLLHPLFDSFLEVAFDVAMDFGALVREIRSSLRWSFLSGARQPLGVWCFS